jgi:hypothetical protein
MSVFDFEPAFGGNNSVSAGTVTGMSTDITAPKPSGTSGGFSWGNTLNILAGIAAPIATGFINANAQKAANKAAAKQADREAAMQAEYLRAQIAAQAANAGNTGAGKMPAWLIPAAAGLAAVGLIFVLLRRK